MMKITSIRQDAARCFAERGFPTTRDEEWRFTNVSSLAKTQFSVAPAGLNVWEGEQLGLTAALRAQGKAAEAVAVEQRFAKAWAESDVKLTASRF